MQPSATNDLLLFEKVRVDFLHLIDGRWSGARQSALELARKAPAGLAHVVLHATALLLDSTIAESRWAATSCTAQLRLR